MSPTKHLLFSPLGVAAIATLALNDGFFKLWAASTAWTPLTGKLSGLAGAIVLPALLDVMLSSMLPRRLAAAMAVGVTAVTFVLLETNQRFVNAYTTATQALYDAVHLPWHATATMDLTDLSVLPMLLLTHWGLRRYAALPRDSQITV